MAEVDSVWVSVLPDFRRFGAEMRAGLARSTGGVEAAGRQAGGRFSEGFKRNLKMGAAIGGAVAGTAALKFLKGSIAEASDLEESLNAVNVSYGKNAEGIKRLGREAANSFGLSNNEFNSLAVQFSAFGQQIAGKGGNVVKVIKDLTGRGADFASVMNLEVNEAMGLFQSGLAGETEPLRKYGIDLSAAAVEAHAYATGIAESGKELTEQQKVQARYSLLMKSTAKTQGDFKNTSDSLANSQRILGANWKNMQATVGRAVLPVMARLSGWALKSGLPALKALGRVFGPLVKAIGSFVATGGAMGAMIRNFKDEMIAGLVAIGVPLLAYGGYVAFVNAQMLLLMARTAIVSAATRAYAAVQWLLNAAMTANPLGLIVVALGLLAGALVYAYKKSDTFRAFVNKAFAGVKKAVAAMWQAVKPVLAAFRDWITKTLMPALRKFWNGVVKPVFKSIGKAIKWAWEHVIKPAFKGWWSYLTNVLIPIVKFLWNKVVKPVFGFIGKLIKGTWNNVIKPVLKLWVGYFRNILFPAIKFLWNKVIKPVFGWIGDKIVKVWRNVVRPAFVALKNFIGTTIPKAFRSGVDAIGKAWDKIKAAAAKPINFVIGTVYNEGIVPFVNKVLGAVGVDTKLKPGKLVKFARGGVMPGYSPGRDVHDFYSPTGGRLSLSGGEAIMRPEWTRRVGGPRAVDAMNKAARTRKNPHRGVGPHLAYHYGGTFPLPGGALTGMHSTPYFGAWHAADYNGPGGGDTDIGMPIVAWKAGKVAVAAMNGEDGSYGNTVVINHSDGNNTRYAHMSAIATAVGRMISAGGLVGRVGATGNVDGGAHLHFEIKGGAASPEGPGGGGGGGGGGSWFNPLAIAAGKVVDWLAGKATGMLGKIPGTGLFAEAAEGVGETAIDGISSWVTDKFGGGSSGVGLNFKDYIPGAGVKQWRGVGLQALKIAGQSPSLINLLLMQMASESGGNPRAVNNWDSNAAAGYPSTGLMQVIRGTYAAYKHPKYDMGPYLNGVSINPLSNILAAIRYSLARYGSLPNAWHGSGYDRGGIARGEGFLPKYTPRPERVLSPRQTVNFERFTAALDRVSASPGAYRSNGQVIILDPDGVALMSGYMDDRIDGHAALAAETMRAAR